MKFTFLFCGIQESDSFILLSPQYDTRNAKIQSFHELVVKDPETPWKSDMKAKDLLIEVTVPEFLNEFIRWKTTFQLIELAAYTFKSGSHLHAAAVHELNVRLPGISLLQELKDLAGVMTDEEKGMTQAFCFGHINQLKARVQEKKDEVEAEKNRVVVQRQEQENEKKVRTSSTVAGATPKAASVSSETSAVAMELSNFTSNFATILARNNEQLLKSIMTISGNGNVPVGDFGRNTVTNTTPLPLDGAPGSSKGPDHLQRPSVGFSMVTPKTEYYNIGTPSESPCCYATPLSLPSSAMGMSTTNPLMLSDEEVRDGLLAVGIPLEVQNKNTKEFNAEQLHKLHVFCLSPPSNSHPFTNLEQDQPVGSDHPAGSEGSSAIIVSRPCSPNLSDDLGGSAPAAPSQGTHPSENLTLRSTTISAPETLSTESENSKGKITVQLTAEEMEEFRRFHEMKEMKRRKPNQEDTTG